MLIEVGHYFIDPETVTFSEQQKDGIAFVTKNGLQGFIAKEEESYLEFVMALQYLSNRKEQ